MINLRMAIDFKKRRLFKRDQELFDFARAYLSEAFPNPERKGCPPDEKLRDLAQRPTESNLRVTEHLTCCSPCFNAYMAHLSRVRVEAADSSRIWLIKLNRRSLRLAAAVIAVVLALAIYVFIRRPHNPPTVAPSTRAPAGPGAPNPLPSTAIYVQVFLDLSNASPKRGGHKNMSPPQVIPSNPRLDLHIFLPLGSEEQLYFVKLSSKGHAVWSESAPAHPENGQMTIQIKADLSPTLRGEYDLEVSSKGFHISAPVVIENLPSARRPQS